MRVKELDCLASIDAIVRNPDCPVRFRVKSDLSELFGEVPFEPVKRTLSDWFFIHISHRPNPNYGILVGYDPDCEPYSTSQVVTVSPDLSAAQTKSGSIYRLRNRGKGTNPGFDLTAHVCYLFWLQSPDFARLADIPDLWGMSKK